jgi:hypothetical protein
VEVSVVRLVVTTVLPLLGLSACNGILDGDPSVDGLRLVTDSKSSTLNQQGLALANFEVDVQAGDAALLLTFQPDAPYVAYVHAAYDPSGAKVFDAESSWDTTRSKTAAGYPSSWASFNWPILGTDGAVQPGLWTFEVGVLDSEYYYVQGVQVTLDGQLKSDPNFNNGGLLVNIVYAGTAAQDNQLKTAMEGATAYWGDLYGQVGIDVAFEYFEYSEGALRAVGQGNEDDYVAIAESTSMRSVNVVVVPSIVGGDQLYGIAGGIPGPLIATGTSGVTVSALNNSGSDMVFDDDEIGLLGETIAHEAGHYTGLFHPVEGTYDTWDAVTDTPECNGESNCANVLGDNLMYPYPICTQQGCSPQDVVTTGQGEVSNRYVGVE